MRRSSCRGGRGFCVLASSEADEGFYAKVGSLLDRPFLNTPAVTAAMEAVWDDLERWLVALKEQDRALMVLTRNRADFLKIAAHDGRLRFDEEPS